MCPIEQSAPAMQDGRRRSCRSDAAVSFPASKECNMAESGQVRVLGVTSAATPAEPARRASDGRKLGLADFKPAGVDGLLRSSEHVDAHRRSRRTRRSASVANDASVRERLNSLGLDGQDPHLAAEMDKYIREEQAAPGSGRQGNNIKLQRRDTGTRSGEYLTPRHHRGWPGTSAALHTSPPDCGCASPVQRRLFDAGAVYFVGDVVLADVVQTGLAAAKVCHSLPSASSATTIFGTLAEPSPVKNMSA